MSVVSEGSLRVASNRVAPSCEFSHDRLKRNVVHGSEFDGRGQTHVQIRMFEKLTQRLHRSAAAPSDFVYDQAAAIHQSVLRRDMVECLPALDVLDILGDQLRVARARQILFVRHSCLLIDAKHHTTID
jgi:hypothetical protein